MPALEDLIREEASRLGFDAVGIARADLALDEDHARYEARVRDDAFGDMGYLGENVEVRRRLDTPDILDGARSVVCVAVRYAATGGDDGLAPRIARYARGRDYHDKLRKRLRKLAAFVRTLGDGVEARPMTDTAPVLEKAWAVRSGLGFWGKNGLVIVPGLGSMVLLGEVVTTLELAPDPPIESRCGSCTRCLDACPTGALPTPFVLEPKRCVAYLTIEHRSPVPEALREPAGGWVFGCDTCQEVCPFNAARDARREPLAQLRAWEGWGDVDLVDALGWSEETWRETTRGTAVVRAGYAGFLRSVALAAGNERRAGARVHLERLASHEDPGVRDAAAWALGRLSAF